ncbi:MAG: triose-phosphate isomerase [Clostridia bacterium]|nr:triose-phosphate isomerase [Clostridia bacterium]
MRYLIANWKMSIDNAKITQFCNSLKKSKFPARVKYGVSIPHVYIAKTAPALKRSGWLVGAQNVAYAESGAYTGENSAKMVASVGADFCLVGHSERRALFEETNEVVNKKLNRIINNGLIPLLCIGETLEEYDQNNTKKVLGRQLKEGLKDIKDIKKLIIAYEPVWAIGTGKVASAKDIRSNITFIKQTIRKMYGESAKVPVLYGGSVKSSNAKEIFAIDCVDGALVGGASLDCGEFLAIAKCL